MTHGILSR